MMAGALMALGAAALLAGFVWLYGLAIGHLVHGPM
jgi:hypothetical protein